MVIAQLYRQTLNRISSCPSDNPKQETKWIFEHFFEKPFPLVMSDKEKEADFETAKKILEVAEKREHGYPLQYLLGEWEFYGLPMKVGEGVLIPRPDTETLIDDVLHLVRSNSMKAPKIADLCSGSGCIAITLKRLIPSAKVYAVELSDDAIGYLKKNAEINSADIHIVQADVLSEKAVEELGDCDIIVSNPPYLTAKDMAELQTEVQKEPEIALYGGDDGLDFYRKMTPLWRNSLKDGGFFLYEFGIGQEKNVEKIMRANGFDVLGLSTDGGGIIRTVTAAIKKG